MPIYSHLKNSAFGPDEIKVIAGAFEATCQELGLVHGEDPLRDAVAKAIMDCVETGERDPLRLQELAQAAIKREWSLAYFVSVPTRPSRSS